MNEDLWGDINLETVFENNNIKKILAQQAELLSKKTNGKIKIRGSEKKGERTWC